VGVHVLLRHRPGPPRRLRADDRADPQAGRLAAGLLLPACAGSHAGRPFPVSRAEVRVASARASASSARSLLCARRAAAKAASGSSSPATSSRPPPAAGARQPAVAVRRTAGAVAGPPGVGPRAAWPRARPHGEPSSPLLVLGSASEPPTNQLSAPSPPWGWGPSEPSPERATATGEPCGRARGHAALGPTPGSPTRRLDARRRTPTPDAAPVRAAGISRGVVP
jgi:hypothetical protein